MFLTFLGAAGAVTGSRFLAESGGRAVLVDCGLFQGERELRRRNWEPFPVSPDHLDAVVISHAHLDHIGWLPRLVSQGYSGPVYLTPDTGRLGAIVLRDAAHLQEEDADYARRTGYSKHDPPLPLFGTEDAEEAIKLFQPIGWHRLQSVTSGFDVVLRRAGHILGSSTVELRADKVSVVFSGDLGNPEHPLLQPAEPPPAADAIVVESTYGDRTRPPGSSDRLVNAVRSAIGRGGTILIPAFALDRTAVLLLTLKQLIADGRIPAVPVYVDSPMALAALDVYRSAIRAGSADISPGLATAADPFDTGTLHECRTVDESKMLDKSPFPSIVVSASGMATGGRVVHHLAAFAPNPRNMILLAGFQVAGTRGRALLDGARTIKAHGRYIPVRAEVVGLEEFSSHAGSDDLMAWLAAAPQPPQNCFAVHGEPQSSQRLADRINHDFGWCAVVPRLHERVRI